MADEPLGRIVLQTDINEVYTLDLYENEGFFARGFYLPPPEHELPAEIPSEVEFAAPGDVWAQLEQSVEEFESDDINIRHYALADPTVTNFRFYVDLARVPNGQRHGAELWTGRVSGYGGEFTFLLNRYSTRVIAAWLILLGILVVFFDQRASDYSAECYRQAVEACGERGVKRYKTSAFLVRLRDMRFIHKCGEVWCN